VHRKLTYTLPLLCIGLHMAYIARIGGDIIGYRPLDVYWPLLAVPAATGIVHLGGGNKVWCEQAGGVAVEAQELCVAYLLARGVLLWGHTGRGSASELPGREESANPADTSTGKGRRLAAHAAWNPDPG